ncbi:DUF2478 domain-containing protein [Nitrobacter sp.]|uniref:DUF2478 domain-containing protein n=1 Tax=unclassified Nitrobacter TaxID=2620411 RepID=UPI002C838B77|nr:DUF2478 domain-containing protein [Nitrobacter sp.]
MFDAQCDLAALVYREGENPDNVLYEFASGLNASGYRAVGIVQLGRHCIDAGLSAMLMPTGEHLQLHQSLDQESAGCRLDVGQLTSAGERIATTLDAGADILIVNRFGRQERKGKGFSHLIERALGDDVPVVIAVPHHHFDDLIKFTGGMTVKLHCDYESLDAWWGLVSTPAGSLRRAGHSTVCEVMK